MEVMIDIETLDTETSAVIFEVAMVFFKGTKRYTHAWFLNTTFQLNEGRTISKDTMEFHLKGLSTADNFGHSLINETSLSVAEFIFEMKCAFERHKPTTCWAKGNFDYPILADMLSHAAAETPWKFYQVRELRTLMKECGVPKGDVAHTALDDCVQQIKNLQACRKVIKNGSKRR